MSLWPTSFPYRAADNSQIEASRQFDSGHKGEADKSSAKETKTRGSEHGAENSEGEASEYWTILGRRLKITDTFLVIFTFTLWWSTRNLVQEASSSSERELRAYIVPRIKHVSSFDETHCTLFRFDIENVGNTPARNVTWHCVAFVAPDPLPDNFVLPEILVSLSHPMTVFPRQSFEGRFNGRQLFTLDEIRALRSGEARIYLRGEIFYGDVFGEEGRKTWFCSFVDVDQDVMEKLSQNYLGEDLPVRFTVARLGNGDD